MNAVGTQDYKKRLDLSAWSYCYINLACKSPPHYPQEFEATAVAIMQQELRMTKTDITVNNAKRVYLHLVDVIEE